jgi:predicted enzyme related to lactoylglutathione lyase
MESVQGIGGLFFKAKGSNAELLVWYKTRLGIDFDSAWGGTVFPERKGEFTWSIFKSDSTYMSPGQADFMVNYIVGDLKAMVEQLRGLGEEVTDIVSNDYGHFSHVVDPAGNRLELWQKPDLPPEGP